MTYFKAIDEGKIKIGSEYVFSRLGDAPANGMSYNYRDNRYEDGVSAMSIAGLPDNGASAMIDTDRPRKWYTGVLIGTGSDDEPIFRDVQPTRRRKQRGQAAEDVAAVRESIARCLAVLEMLVKQHGARVNDRGVRIMDVIVDRNLALHDAYSGTPLSAHKTVQSIIDKIHSA